MIKSNDNKAMPINGYTKESIKKVITERFKGKSFLPMGDEDECLYRSEVNGEIRACVVGCFIPDDKYHSAMESQGPSTLFNRFGLANVLPLTPDALGRFQIVHDNLDSTAPVAEQLSELLAWVDSNVL